METQRERRAVWAKHGVAQVHVTECSRLSSPLQACSSLLCAWTSFRLDIYPEGRNLLPRDANMQRIIHITRKVSARYAPEVPYIRRLPELCYLPDAGRQSTSPTHSLPYIHTGLHPRNNLTLKDGLTKSEI
jgi:hypothetical protein